MLKLQLLGGRRLLQGRRDISAAIHYRKGWALLGYLAVEPRKRHSREQIAQLLWPALEPAAARTNLRQVLANLNQVLDGPHGNLIEITREDIALALQENREVTIDLLALEDISALLLEPEDSVILAAEKNAETFGGQFMSGFSLPDCVEYENWLIAVRQRLAAATEEALSRLCRAQQLIGRIPQATASARRLVALDDWNEDYRRQLMLLLAESGLHQQALDQYSKLAASLHEELETTPDPQTQILRARIEADFRRVRAAAGAGLPPLRSRAGQPMRLRDGDNTDAERLLTQRTMQVGGGAFNGHAMSGWLLLAEKDAGLDRRITITREPVVIGRSRSCEVCIVHDTVSRQHCAVWRGDDGFRIRDLGSTNGTRVNGASVQEAVLGDGDQIVLGELLMQFGCEVMAVDDDITR